MSNPEQAPLPFNFESNKGYFLIKLIGALEPGTAAQFQEAFLAQIQSIPNQPIVVNCDRISKLSKQWLRALVVIAQENKKLKQETRYILAPKEMKQLLQEEAIGNAMILAPNVRDALIQLGLLQKKALDADFVNPFLTSTIQVIKIQASTESKPGKLFLKTDKQKLSGDISGIIGIMSESFTGSVVLSFPESTYLKLMSRMLNEDLQKLTKEIADGAGELTNIIFGQAKIILNEKGYGINTAIPSVVTGKNHIVLSQSNGPTVVVPFETELGPFFVEISVSG